MFSKGEQIEVIPFYSQLEYLHLVKSCGMLQCVPEALDVLWECRSNALLGSVEAKGRGVKGFPASNSSWVAEKHPKAWFLLQIMLE